MSNQAAKRTTFLLASLSIPADRYGSIPDLES